MALVSKFEAKDPSRTNLHKEVAGSYSIVEIDGEVFVQLDTYGSTDRQIPGKVSQSLQLNQSSARQLFEILGREFGLK